MTLLARVLAATAAALFGALVSLLLQHHHDILLSSSSSIPLPSWLASLLTPHPQAIEPFTCQPHSYTTEIISVDPLLIYIHDFLAPGEIPALLEAGEPLFQPSGIHRKSGGKAHNQARTSHSAILPVDLPAAQCVRNRAVSFLGTLLTIPQGDDVLPLQLVRYGPGQRFDAHFDWFSADRLPEHNGVLWNRVATFLPVLEDDCTAGETWFPNVSAPAKAVAESRARGGEALWRVHEDGGIAVRPVKGNAVFWVNLLANGTGDVRTKHAGLPVDSGIKTAMNIWPARFFS
ncbi:hypothetical protein M406DRAFT_262993 [Cryphonectria parasitica EP155]|uniref:Fe2OG dioxygenase domain-containing protein n=1 Tax=Cryphonectria parasitica (strain ATCC 38755 / EP155) TaxID=660469 RepID=A0A9P4XYJ6_CRYP1|nr:uncharacterized protein M406DRAFT_262993 [Cryphonectria parasitica EP155]KAF3763363.1 hypothetical protein M406DRAFT_262993 [Cryphonectria parasitica EP155]